MKRIGALLAITALAVIVNASVSEDQSEHSIQFVASNLFQTANGTFHEWKVTETRIDPDDLARSFVKVEVDLASVDTGTESRDDHLRTEDFFDVESYPTATVRVHGAEKIGSTEEGRDRYRASFDIDLHGVKKTLPGEFVVLTRTPVVVEGTVLLDRLDFGIGEPRSFWNPMSITEEVPVSFRAAIPH